MSIVSIVPFSPLDGYPYLLGGGLSRHGRNAVAAGRNADPCCPVPMCVPVDAVHGGKPGYYLAGAADHKEMLLIFREGGVFQMSVIVKDGREVYQGNWSRKGDQLTITYRAGTKDCGGASGPPQTFVQSFVRGAVGLSLTRGDVHRLFYKATAAQVGKVLGVRQCN